MKGIMAVVACSLFLVSNLHANEQVSQRELARVTQEIGRYQLFQGLYTTYDLKRQQTSTANAVFLVDTATGQVKRYVNKIDEDGKYIESWVSTDFAPSDKKK